MKIIEPICFGCKHLISYPRCVAFPDGIPKAIKDVKHDHREPYDGDNGIRFEPIDEGEAE